MPGPELLIQSHLANQAFLSRTFEIPKEARRHFRFSCLLCFLHFINAIKWLAFSWFRNPNYRTQMLLMMLSDFSFNFGDLVRHYILIGATSSSFLVFDFSCLFLFSGHAQWLELLKEDLAKKLLTSATYQTFKKKTALAARGCHYLIWATHFAPLLYVFVAPSFALDNYFSSRLVALCLLPGQLINFYWLSNAVHVIYAPFFYFYCCCLLLKTVAGTFWKLAALVLAHPQLVRDKLLFTCLISRQNLICSKLALYDRFWRQFIWIFLAGFFVCNLAMSHLAFFGRKSFYLTIIAYFAAFVSYLLIFGTSMYAAVVAKTVNRSFQILNSILCKHGGKLSLGNKLKLQQAVERLGSKNVPIGFHCGSLFTLTSFQLFKVKKFNLFNYLIN